MSKVVFIAIDYRRWGNNVPKVLESSTKLTLPKFYKIQYVSIFVFRNIYHDHDSKSDLKKVMKMKKN